MTIIETQGDLFAAPQGFYLAHCISGDYALGAGVAQQMDEAYNMRHKLHRDYPIGSGMKYANVGEALLVDNVFNLVTKPRCYHKPTYDKLRETLESMKNMCLSIDVQKLAMPKIGCGLDKLDWDKVKEIFEDTDIYILIYTL